MHAANVIKVALRMRRYLNRRNASNPVEWICRIGSSTGGVIGSPVGVQKYVCDIFGPAVNLAARPETHREPMQVTRSEQLYELLRDDFGIFELGEFEIKGFGTQHIYIPSMARRDVRRPSDRVSTPAFEFAVTALDPVLPRPGVAPRRPRCRIRRGDRNQYQTSLKP